MFWTEIPWWQRRSQMPWMFWSDPWGELRVTPSGRYFYDRPCQPHAEALERAGWRLDDRNPHDVRYVYTDDAALARDSLAALGLALPEWKGRHSYRVYWHEPVYNI